MKIRAAGSTEYVIAGTKSGEERRKREERRAVMRKKE
jgi:hypothetical protein